MYLFIYLNTKNNQEQIPQIYLAIPSKNTNQQRLLLCIILREVRIRLTANEHHLPLYGLYSRKNQTHGRSSLPFKSEARGAFLLAKHLLIIYSKVEPSMPFVVLTCRKPHIYFFILYFFFFSKPLEI